jgi:hypothetical protein
MVKKKSKTGRQHKAGTGNRTSRSRALIVEQHVATSTPNNPLTVSIAPLIMTSSATAARMPPPTVLQFAEHQQDLMPHAFNNQAIEYGKIPSFKPNQNAFNHSLKDIPLSAASAHKAKSRAVRDIAVAVENAGSLHHQVVALNGAMMHPKMRCVGKSIGFAADAEIALFHQEQQKRMIALALTTTTEKGRPTDDKRSFAQSLILASASSPNSKPIGNRKRAKVLGLPYSTTHRLFKNAKVVRSQLKNIEEGLSWSTVCRKKVGAMLLRKCVQNFTLGS